MLVKPASFAQSTAAVGPGVALPQELRNPELLAEIGRVLEKIQHGVQFPPGRSQSRLLPLLPKSTTLYIAFSNYGEASHQALKVFQQELQENQDLRGWWQRGEMASTGPKVEESLERFYQLSQYLGDEIAVSAATEGRQDPSFLMLAEVRKPGLKDFLRKSADGLSSKSKQGILVVDLRELATAKDATPPQQFAILVRPDFVVAAPTVAALRSFNAHLDQKVRDFSGTPFEQRLSQAYDGGATAVGGADVQKIISQIPTGSPQGQDIFRRTGFADAKYLILEHKNVAGQVVNQMELSFAGPRHGVAAWLAAPRPMGSLEFVSPHAVLVSSLLLNDPAQIFEDVKDLATISDPNAFATLPKMEQGLHLSLREDLLRTLDGELTIELHRFAPPDEPEWKVIFGVKDAGHLQATLATLLATAPFNPTQFEEGGVTYHILQIPSARKVVEIGYAFVDGYLVIASGRKTLAEAIRIHRSGESLAKSRKFLDALPPGHDTGMSAMLLQDPIAMGALRMRQMPEMAALFAKLPNEGAPTIMCAYGEEQA